MTSTQPAIPVEDGMRLPTSDSSPSPGDRLEHELVGLLVEQEDRRRLRAEDRARDLDDRPEQRAVLLLRGEHAGGDGRVQVCLVHRPPPTFVAIR